MEREKLVGAITLRILQSMDLNSIMNQTVEEVRLFLQTDRVLVYRFEPDWSGLMVAESVIQPWDAVFGSKIKDPCFTEKQIEQYKQGRIQAVSNIENSAFNPGHKNLLASLDVKANLVVPIITEEKLWGLLIAQHCTSNRQWHSSEVELLTQLANHVGIAAKQAELYHKVQSFNVYLERKIQKQTKKLQRSLRFEALLRRMSEKVRDSLDEKQILQTVTQEIGELFKIEQCKIELYNKYQTAAIVAYEYTISQSVCQGTTRKIADFPELYRQLLQKQSLQFVEVDSQSSLRTIKVTRLVCPIFDDQGILGNIWLLRPPNQMFDELEISLVKQVANQCAIAIRQARLYQAAQSQVEELEKLNTLKDNFLKTISHELRTPMSSIFLASQTLEKLIETQGIDSINSPNFQRIFQIFKSSCHQQNKLIKDLLTLCYIDAESAILIPESIDLKVFIPELVEPFKKQTQQQQQHLVVNLPQELSLVNSDVSFLERVLKELLTNACKYTPAQETITVKAWESSDNVFLSVSNSGVEIPPEEQESIFEKFYRIPSHDPWQYGGTGIGLALVKKLVELLGATIQVDSQRQQTSFTMQFPSKKLD